MHVHDCVPDLATTIVTECRALGFHRVGITPVEPAQRHELYRAWLAAGHAGEMAYLREPFHVDTRRDPRALFAEAKTVVAVALAYGDMVPASRIARYARGADYHLVLREKLDRLSERIDEAAGRPIARRLCVDTAPVLERDLAERAGLGFVAKNTMLIAPGLGSYVVLGEMLLAVEVPPLAVEPVRKRCGTCRACIDACPTGAFVDEYVLDARKCISYLTIELAGPIPHELRGKMGTMIFGCDICQEVCPFNGGPGSLVAAPELAAHKHVPELTALLELGAAQFRRFVKRTALRRVHRQQLLRNVCIALGNAGDSSAIPALRRALVDRHPLVRGHAAWALGRLGDRATLTERSEIETDPYVLGELRRALSS